MTPTEEKAKAEAQRLIDEAKLTLFEWGVMTSKVFPIVIAVKIAKETISALNSVKGLSKMSQLKLWKLILKNLEDKR